MRRDLPLKDGVHGSVGATGRLPGSVLRGDEDDVEEVGDDHHGAVERKLLLPLGVLGRPKDAHDGRDDDPGHGLRHNGREAEEVALRYFRNQESSIFCSLHLEGWRDVLERGEAGKIAKHSEAAKHLSKRFSGRNSGKMPPGRRPWWHGS